MENSVKDEKYRGTNQNGTMLLRIHWNNKSWSFSDVSHAVLITASGSRPRREKLKAVKHQERNGAVSVAKRPVAYRSYDNSGIVLSYFERSLIRKMITIEQQRRVSGSVQRTDVRVWLLMSRYKNVLARKTIRRVFMIRTCRSM